jgi:hypothetical protein
MHQLTKATWQRAAGGHIAAGMWQRYAFIEVPVTYINTVSGSFRINHNLLILLLCLLHMETVWSQ